MIIAVDFDGTIVEHKYPEIGRELPFAIETLKKLLMAGFINGIFPEQPYQFLSGMKIMKKDSIIM